jgi:hypothetical protein
MGICCITVPVLLETTTEASQLFLQWTTLYGYGHQALPALAVGTSATYALACANRRRAKKSWKMLALAGLTTFSMIPFTWIFMVPTNSELFRLQEVSRKEPMVMGIVGAAELVKLWSTLHFVRSLFPLVGTLMGTIGSFWE